MFTSKFYVNSPIFLQNIIVSLVYLIRKILRDNSKTRAYKKELYENEYSIEKSTEYTQRKLKQTLKNAVENSEFYRNNPDIDPDNLDSFPYISKKDLLANPKAFTAEKKPFPSFNVSTSGTTGSPLVVATPLETLVLEEAFISRMREWAGFEKGDRRAWIRADQVVPAGQTKAPYWRTSWFDDMLIMSSYHITEEALPLYLEKLMDFDPAIISIYPSTITVFARYLESQGKYYKGNLKAILTSSESFAVEDKALVEERFGSRVVEWYSMVERASAITNCEHGNYHVVSDYAYTEFLDAGDGRHEIVGTSFNNPLFPVIRYRTGDYLVLKEDQSCPCGRVYPVVDRVHGRIGDYLIGENGQKVHVLNTVPKGVLGVLACQFIQDRLGYVEAMVVANKSVFDDAQEQKLIHNIRLHLGHSMEVGVTLVETLPKTRNGKVRQAVCSIKDVPQPEVEAVE